MRGIVGMRLALALIMPAASIVITQTPARAECGCEDLAADLSTGVDAQGTLLPVSASDPRWRSLASGTQASVIQKHAVWTPTAGTSGWLNDRTRAQNLGLPGGDVNAPPGLTTIFAIDFDATNQVGLALDFKYSADDGVDFYLNSGSTPIGGAPYTGTGSPPWMNEHTLHYTGPELVPGPNTLYAHVYNWILWTGFYVRGGVTGRCGVHEITSQIGTGVDSSGSLMSQGDVDDDWDLIQRPMVTGPSDAYAIIPSSTLAGAWTATPTDSRWIAPVNSDEPAGPAGDYVYQDTVPVPCGLDVLRPMPLTVCLAQIDLEYAADNSVRFTWNGTTIGSTADPAFQSVNTLSATVDCRAGIGALRAIVDNDFGYTGLFVEGTITFTVI